MCFPPLIIAGLALAAGGTGMKYFGEKKAANAQEAANQAERKRQIDMTAEQTAFFGDSVNKANNIADEGAMKDAADSRNAALSDVIVPASQSAAYLPGAGSANQVVADQGAQAAETTRAQAGSLAAALAALGGTQDQMQQANIGIGRDSQKIGQVSRDKQQSANALTTDLRSAAYKGSFLRGAGGLAQMFGKAMMAGGGGGGSVVPLGQGTSLPAIY
jgi:hypothetical protein